MQGLRHNNEGSKVLLKKWCFPVSACPSTAVSQQASRNPTLFSANFGDRWGDVERHALVDLGGNHSRLLAILISFGEATRVTFTSAIMHRLSTLGTRSAEARNQSAHAEQAGPSSKLSIAQEPSPLVLSFAWPISFLAVKKKAHASKPR